MYDFHPYFTNDGSTGLYSPEFNDIYHSASGALTEACEKFIKPSHIDYLLNNYQQIKVLDICYGIGYNTKSLLNYIFEKYDQKFGCPTDYYAQIHTDKTKNILSTSNDSIYTDNHKEQSNTNIGTVYTHNKPAGIFINAIDNDENLFCLSPFIKTGEKDFAKHNLNIPCDKIHKYLTDSSPADCMKINNLVNYVILDNIVKQFPQIFANKEINSILSDKNLDCFFENDIRGIYRSLNNQDIHISLLRRLNSFLHNIYYRHVSNGYKRRLKGSILNDFILDFKCGDARKIISRDSDKYHLIFLDAFTPSKCPCLWSLEFFKLLFEHMEPDGMLLTYSSSAAVRSAMIEAGFFIGNIFSPRENKFIGTAAVKNKTFIKYPLSESDLGLLKTRAGIFYRDPDLNGQNEAIIEQRNFEVKNSNLQSSSEYKRVNNL